MRFIGIHTCFKDTNQIIDHNALSIPDPVNPIYMKEKKKMETCRRLLDYIYTSVLFLIGSFYLLNHFRYSYGFRNLDEMIFWPVFLTPLFIIPYAVNTFRNARDGRDGERLQTALLSPRKIVWGKFCGGMRLYTWRYLALMGLPFILACIIYLNLTSSPPRDLHYERTKNYYLLISVFFLGFAWASFYLSWGMYFSLQSRNTINAYLKTFVLFLAILLFPFLMLFDAQSAMDYQSRAWQSPFWYRASLVSPLFYTRCFLEINNSHHLLYPSKSLFTVTSIQASWMMLSSLGAIHMILGRLSHKMNRSCFAFPISQVSEGEMQNETPLKEKQLIQ